MNEGLHPNFAKQITKLQKKQPVNQQLDQLFGKNVYRLYYDLQTGKQIFPNKKDPQVKFDVDIHDDLKDDISRTLEQHEYQVQDFEGNRALNKRNGQVLKISKILAKTDIALLTKYSDFLENMTRKVEGNFYAVISRHVYDLAMQGTHENFQSCENLEDVADYKDTMFYSKNRDGGENPFGDGRGERSHQMMVDGSVVFYMIKEGDWNIQHPVARFSEGTYCIDSDVIYGNFSPKFKAFIKKWLRKFNLEYRKTPGLVSDDEFFQKPAEELADMLRRVTSRKTFNNLNGAEFMRGLVTRKRFDVFAAALVERYKGELEVFILAFAQNLVLDLSPKFLLLLPEEIRNKYLVEINKLVDGLYGELANQKKNIEDFLRNPKTKLMQLADIFGGPEKLKLFKDEGVFTMVGLHRESIFVTHEGGRYYYLIQLSKALGNPKAAFVAKESVEVAQYFNGKKHNIIPQIWNQTVAELTQQVAVHEQLTKMRSLMMLTEGKMYQSPVAAGCLLVSRETKKCLVGLRSKRCDSPHTWGPFGGSVEKGETIKEGLLRELEEEIGFTGEVELHESWLFERKNFKYHTFIGLVEKEFEPAINDETDEVKWLTLEELRALPKKHHGFAEYVKNAKEDLEKYLS